MWVSRVLRSSWRIIGGAKGPAKSLGAQRLARVTLLSASGGLALGIGYSAYTHYNVNNSLVPKVDVEPLEQKPLPEDLVPTRKITGTLTIPNSEIILFQYQTCPFCCKVRAFLDSNGFSYSVVEVDAVLRQSIKWSKYKKVPILVIKNENGFQQLNDSTLIISVLSSYLLEKNTDIGELMTFYPNITYVDDDGKSKDEILNKYFLMFQHSPTESVKAKLNEERKWRKWSDEVLVHMLSPNVYRTLDEAYQAFNWFAEIGDWHKHFPSWEVSLMINVGAYVMWLIGKRLKKKHNLKEDVRLSLYDECNHWLKGIEKKQSDFMGGASPDLSDLAVYGVLNSIEGCDSFRDLLENTNINKWYSRMKKHIDANRGTVVV